MFTTHRAPRKLALLCTLATTLGLPAWASESTSKPDPERLEAAGWSGDGEIAPRSQSTASGISLNPATSSVVKRARGVRPPTKIDSSHTKHSLPASLPVTLHENRVQENRSSRGGDYLRAYKFRDPHPAIPDGFNSLYHSPSLAWIGHRVMYTGNWYAAWSTDDGLSFDHVDPFTGPFAPVNNGFAGDQHVVYDPKRNVLYYLQEYRSDGVSGTHRLNVDQGANGSFECSYDLHPQLFGDANGHWVQTPDLALSDAFVYVSGNVFSVPGFQGGYVARLNANQVSTCGIGVFSFYRDPTYGSFELTRGAKDTMYFADHFSNTALRIWTWPDVGPRTVVNRAAAAWTSGTRSCPGPNGRDWCQFITDGIAAAWVARGDVGFMWVPRQDAMFSVPYILIARFRESDMGLIETRTISTPSCAYAYPSVAVNRDGELGGTIMFGCDTFTFPGCKFWIEFGEGFGSFDTLDGSISDAGPLLNHSGDYLSAQVNHPYDRTFVGACFGYGSEVEAFPRAIHFGRESDIPIFADDFDSGDFSWWSAVTQ